MARTEIRVDFTANTSRFVAGARKVNQTLVGLSRGWAGLFGAAIAASAIRSVMDFASQLKDLSDRTGISTDELQAFNYAAKQTGASLEDMVRSFEFLARARQKALGGGKDQLAGFAAIGVSREQLAGADTKSLLGSLAAALQRIGPERLAQAMQQLGGKGSAALIPMLRNLKELRAEWDRLGTGISQQNIEAIDRMGDAYERLKIRGLSALAPLVAMADKMATAGQSGNRATMESLDAKTIASALMSGPGRLSAVMDVLIGTYGKARGDAIEREYAARISKATSGRRGAEPTIQGKAEKQKEASQLADVQSDALARIGLYRGTANRNLMLAQKAVFIASAQLREAQRTNAILTSEEDGE